MPGTRNKSARPGIAQFQIHQTRCARWASAPRLSARLAATKDLPQPCVGEVMAMRSPVARLHRLQQMGAQNIKGRGCRVLLRINEHSVSSQTFGGQRLPRVSNSQTRSGLISGSNCGVENTSRPACSDPVSRDGAERFRQDETTKTRHQRLSEPSAQVYRRSYFQSWGNAPYSRIT